MIWYEKDIEKAISISKERRSLFVVLVEDDDTSQGKAWTSEEVKNIIEKNRCVLVRIKAHSLTAKQFSQLYPVSVYPTVYFIDNAGKPVKIQPGYQTPSELISIFERALENHKEQNEIGESSASALEPDQPSSEECSVQASLSQLPLDVADSIDEQLIEVQPSGQVSSTGIHPSAPSQSTNVVSGIKPEGTDPVGTKAEESVERNNMEELEKKEKIEKEIEEARRQKNIEYQAMKEDLEKKGIQKKNEKEAKEEEEERKMKRVLKDAEDQLMKEKLEEKDRRINVQKSKEEEEKKKIMIEKKTRAMIQFKLPDGSTLVSTFEFNESLMAAKQFVLQKLEGRISNIKLKKLRPMVALDDLDQTFADYDLCPSAVLVVSYETDELERPQNQNVSGLVALWAKFILILQYLLSWIIPTSPGQASVQPPQPTSSPSDDPIPSNQTADRTKLINRNKGLRQRKEGNIHRLTADDEDDESATWNGNSTQQM